MNKDGLSRRECTVTDVKHYMSGALRTIKNITRSMVNWKNKFVHSYISKILFIDKGFLKCKFLCMYFSWILLIDSELPTLKMDFFKVLLINFRIATSLITQSSKRYSWKIFFIDFKTDTKKIHFKLHCYKSHMEIHAKGRNARRGII